MARNRTAYDALVVVIDSDVDDLFSSGEDWMPSSEESEIDGQLAGEDDDCDGCVAEDVEMDDGAALGGEVDDDASIQGKQNLDEVQVASAATNAAISVLVVSADHSEGTVNNGDSSLRNCSATTQRGKGRGTWTSTCATRHCQVSDVLVVVDDLACSLWVRLHPGNLSASASTNTGWNKLDTEPELPVFTRGQVPGLHLPDNFEPENEAFHFSDYFLPHLSSMQ